MVRKEAAVMIVKYYYGDWVFTRYEEYEKLETENIRLQEHINKIIDDHALRDKLEPNKPILALWKQPLIIKELIEALERRRD